MARLCTAALQDMLDSWSPLTSAAICDLYTWRLTGGEVLRYSGWQTAVLAPAPATDSPLFDFSLGPKFKRNKVKFQLGIQVDELEVEIYAGAGDLVLTGGALSWQEALHKGVFDGASLELWRCFMSPPGTVVGTLAWFTGRVADVDIGRTRSLMRIKSLLDLLNAQMPRRLFQAGCTHVFGDAMCQFDRSSMAQDITALSGTTNARIVFSGAAPDPATLYDNGTVTGLTGANTGYKRTIRNLAYSIVYVLDPWIFPIAIGDTFELLPGCDHTLDTCQNTFDNLVHFGGFPYVPPPESAA